MPLNGSNELRVEKTTNSEKYGLKLTGNNKNEANLFLNTDREGRLANEILLNQNDVHEKIRELLELCMDEIPDVIKKLGNKIIKVEINGSDGRNEVYSIKNSFLDRIKDLVA